MTAERKFAKWCMETPNASHTQSPIKEKLIIDRISLRLSLRPPRRLGCRPHSPGLRSPGSRPAGWAPTVCRAASQSKARAAGVRRERGAGTAGRQRSSRGPGPGRDVPGTPRRILPAAALTCKASWSCPRRAAVGAGAARLRAPGGGPAPCRRRRAAPSPRSAPPGPGVSPAFRRR